MLIHDPRLLLLSLELLLVADSSCLNEGHAPVSLLSGKRAALGDVAAGGAGEYK